MPTRRRRARRTPRGFVDASYARSADGGYPQDGAAVEAAMPAIPFCFCAGAADPPQALVDASPERGFRRAVEVAMGGHRGCRQLKDLFMALATKAHRLISA
ncbi:DUF2889 domain-containing protein [Cupriavidus sp. 8B]